MKAIVVESKGKATIQEIPTPALRPDSIKIKPHAVALNPTDWKHIDNISDAGCIIGCDVAGVVEEVGSAVTTPVKPGDAVYGFVHGGNVSNHSDGGFAEHALVKDGVFVAKPDNLSFEEAATLACGVGTVGQAMYQRLGWPTPASPAKEPFPVLIYGGSTATGTLAVQFAALSGLTVIATASKRNHEMLKALGAAEVFDYSDPECGAKIREYTKDNLRNVFDCIALPDAMKICADALASSADGGELKYGALLPPKGFPRSDVKTSASMLYTATGERYEKLGRTVEPKPEDREYVVEWFKSAAPLIAEGKIKPHPMEVGKGFEGILQGLDAMRKGEVSAKKMVYTLV